MKTRGRGSPRPELGKAPEPPAPGCQGATHPECFFSSRSMSSRAATYCGEEPFSTAEGRRGPRSAGHGGRGRPLSAAGLPPPAPSLPRRPGRAGAHLLQPPLLGVPPLRRQRLAAAQQPHQVQLQPRRRHGGPSPPEAASDTSGRRAPSGAARRASLPSANTRTRKAAAAAGTLRGDPCGGHCAVLRGCRGRQRLRSPFASARSRAAARGQAGPVAPQPPAATASRPHGWAGGGSPSTSSTDGSAATPRPRHRCALGAPRLPQRCSAHGRRQRPQGLPPAERLHQPGQRRMRERRGVQKVQRSNKRFYMFWSQLRLLQHKQFCKPHRKLS